MMMMYMCVDERQGWGICVGVAMGNSRVDGAFACMGA